MNSLSVAIFLCLGALVSAHGWVGYEDGSYNGEGLVVSQEHGQYYYGYAPVQYAGIYAYGAAPLGADGNVIDTPEVAHAKIAHFAAKANIAHGAHETYAPIATSQDAGENYLAPAHYAGVHAYRAAPLGADGNVIDTPEVAQAKADHYEAYSRISQGIYAPLTYTTIPAQYAGVYAYGAAPIGADGNVVDTAEVAHAKIAHFSAKAAASHGAGGYYYAPAQYAGVYGYGAAPVGADGNVVDTPEVAQAKLDHYAAVSKASSTFSAHYAHGAAPVGADGSVVDTPEVAQAKLDHYAAVSRISQGSYAPHAYAAVPAHYAHGAAPVGADGSVVDTPEVAQAKVAHFAAKAAFVQGSHGVYSPLSYTVAPTAAPAYYAGVYAHGAAAVVDTPEVAHAKIAHYAAVSSISHGAQYYDSDYARQW